MKKLVILLIICSFSLLIGCNRVSKTSTGSNSNSTSIKAPQSNELTNKISIEDLSRYFTGYDGCFLLFDQKNDEFLIYNEEKSNKQISPCSTFKIVNSLVGLETNVLEDENTPLKWDGTKYPIDEWNKDQTLSTAVSNSVVWYFQKTASKIGNEQMQNYLNKLDYGNKDISGGITKFWLQSSLKISPKQQIGMLIDFYNNKLPFSERNINIVKKVIKFSDENGIVFSGKTGSGTIENKSVNGWFIGYVEKNNNVFFFVTNLEAKDNASGENAKKITIQILKDKNIL